MKSDKALTRLLDIDACSGYGKTLLERLYISHPAQEIRLPLSEYEVSIKVPEKELVAVRRAAK